MTNTNLKSKFFLLAFFHNFTSNMIYFLNRSLIMIQLKKSPLLMRQPKERTLLIIQFPKRPLQIIQPPKRPLLIIQPPKRPLEKKTELGIVKGPIKNVPCHLGGKRLVTREKLDPLKGVGIFMFLVQVVKNFAAM